MPRDSKPDATEEIEITPAMIEAGEDVILCEVGGADLGGAFSAGDLAKRVYLAMRGAAADQDRVGSLREPFDVRND